MTFSRPLNSKGPASALQEVSEGSQTIADDLGDGQHGHGENGPGNATNLPLPRLRLNQSTHSSVANSSASKFRHRGSALPVSA